MLLSPPGNMFSYIAVLCTLGVAAAAPSDAHHGAAVDSVSIPRYGFNYAVNDPHTGDIKAQTESRDGGVVKGSYSLTEPDGTLRVVDYSADPVSGFNAVVKRMGPAGHPHSYVAHPPPNKHMSHGGSALIAPVGAVPLGSVAGLGFGGHGLGHGHGLGLGHDHGFAGLGHAGLGHGDHGHAGLAHADLGHAGLGHAGLGHAGLGHAELGWGHAEIGHMGMGHGGHGWSHGGFGHADLGLGHGHAGLGHEGLGHAGLGLGHAGHGLGGLGYASLGHGLKH